MHTFGIQMLIILATCFSASLFGQANFGTSLHATRNGKPYWYNTANGGFEGFTSVPVSQIGCVTCHGATNADGQPYPPNYTPGCIDCHPSNSAYNPDSIKVSQCYGCHSRQAAEANALGYPDVHRSLGMKCWDCHTSDDMHGNGTAYNSMLEPGAMEPDCIDCHTTLPAGHGAYDPPAHNNKLHCSACHSRTVISCYNCHFESQVQNQVKRPKQQIHGFVILANRTKDNRIYPMSFQSVTYQGNAFVAFGPFTSHTITDSGRVCAECHVNLGGTNTAITQYNTTGQIRFATWNSSDSTLSYIKGIVPMPLDYGRAFKMDFLEYMGDPGDPVAPSKNWRFIGKDTWDGHQMFFATPLTKVQMKKMGFDTTLTTGVKVGEDMPQRFQLEQNFPNPFNPSTTLQFSVARKEFVRIEVFDASGKRVATLVSQSYEQGRHETRWEGKSSDGTPVSSGVYIVRMNAGNFSDATKMLLLR